MDTGIDIFRKEHGEEAIVFDIQRFSLHDGPGVRTTVFFKGCPLRCMWCQNPESRRRSSEMSFNRNRCSRCFACGDACEKKAIVQDEQHRIDFVRCDACGKCAETCTNEALRLIGKPWSRSALFREIILDSDFFLDSGGGVTFSGGEPFLQPDFILGLSRELRHAAIHTLAETSGFFDNSLCGLIAVSVDCIFFDLKHADSVAHRSLTGQGNELILKNFFALSKRMKDVQARMPVVPGINDDNNNIRETAILVKKAGKHSIHCLPYHGLGNTKLGMIKNSQAPLAIQPPSPHELERVKTLFMEEGINAVMYT